MALPTVRAASVTDVTAIAFVGSRSFTAAYAESTNADDLRAHVARHFTAKAVRSAMADTACRYLLAEIDAEPAGFAKIRQGESSPASVPGNPATELQQLYVEPSCQRRGVGEALVAAARQLAECTGTEGLWLSVWEDAHWAVAFYENRGFRAVGRAEFRVGSTLYQDLLMWMPVAGDTA